MLLLNGLNLILIAIYYEPALGLTCLDCDSIAQPRHCRTVARCNAGEVCGTERLPTFHGLKYYRLGCVKPTSCLSATQSNNSAVCSHCCNADLCNVGVCGENGYPNRRGPICYSCQYGSTIQLCRKIDFCSDTEECSILGQDEFGDVIYNSQCKPRSYCANAPDQLSNIVGKRLAGKPRSGNHVLCDTCCSADLCNLNCSYDHCYSSPCQHGNCSSDGSSFTCHCTSGWGGRYCEKELTTIRISTASTMSITTTTVTTSVDKVTSTAPEQLFATDCKDILRHGLGITSGEYTIYMDVNGITKTRQVYCDMVTDGGGWTVFQKRFNGTVDFFQNFSEYENGFGTLSGEFWLGLKWVYFITKNKTQELRVDIVNRKNQTLYEKYSHFSLGVPPLYTLHVSSVGTGSAGDGLNHRYSSNNYIQNGQAFTTKDNDNDRWYNNCAILTHAGFWYNACAFSNLNGRYTASEFKSGEGFYWNGTSNILESSEMKIRPA